MNCHICNALAYVFTCSATISAVAQESPDFKQGRTDGFNDRFDEDYRKGKAEQDGHNAAASISFLIAVAGATYRRDSGPSYDAHRFAAPKKNGPRTASISVTNRMCGDPSPGNRKSLKVTYLCGSLAKTTAA